MHAKFSSGIGIYDINTVKTEFHIEMLICPSGVTSPHYNFSKFPVSETVNKLKAQDMKKSIEAAVMLKLQQHY